ncbi:S41 family peptidase [Streptomyces sp. NPDC089799]|uniref:S41 family peptidase n=1 Tax=Streptomyces sp. NPDC089799 TaxID=3155066 RepID=UPI0034387759
MPGRPAFCPRPRDLRRGAFLTLALLGALGTAAGTGCLGAHDDRTVELSRAGGAGLSASAAPLAPPGATPGDPAAQPPAASPGTVDRDALARAAADAVADGKSGKKAAQDVVSRSGDRWAVVYDRAEYAGFEEDLDGTWTGVGLWPGRERDGLVPVDRVQSAGPADRAGIRAGDRLVAVAGRPVAGLSATAVVALLRGAAGTSVVLDLERGGVPRAETLVRERLHTDPVTVRGLPGGITAIRVSAFTRGSGERVREAVAAAPPGGGILLDLRGNPGGLVTEAVRAASAFLDGGLVATYDVRGSQRALYADRGGDTARPLVALVDGGTMSAAELLTGALQDRGRAVTVGSRTFGKGSVQMPTELPDGSVAELTVGTYRTPGGRCVDGRGITPDLTARGERAEERARAVFGGHGVAP